MSIKRPGRPVGRVKLLAENPFRYVYALAELTIGKCRVTKKRSELAICNTFAAFMVGRPAMPGEVVTDREGAIRNVTQNFQDCWRMGSPLPVIHRRWDKMPEHNRTYFRNQTPGSHWRDRKRVPAAGDDMRRRLRLWRNAPRTNVNRQWLEAMVRVMNICIEGGNADVARSIVNAIGEKAYFEGSLRPILVRRQGRDIFPINDLVSIMFPACCDAA